MKTMIVPLWAACLLQLASAYPPVNPARTPAPVLANDITAAAPAPTPTARIFEGYLHKRAPPYLQKRAFVCPPDATGKSQMPGGPITTCGCTDPAASFSSMAVSTGSCVCTNTAAKQTTTIAAGKTTTFCTSCTFNPPGNSNTISMGNDFQCKCPIPGMTLTSTKMGQNSNYFCDCTDTAKSYDAATKSCICDSAATFISVAGGACSQCPTGASVRNNACTCTKGFVLPGAGGASCICPTDSYTNDMSTCTACPAAGMAAVDNQKSCTCTDGYQTVAGPGQTSCRACWASATADPKHTTCICTAGTVTLVAGASSCKTCDDAATFVPGNPGTTGSCSCPTGISVYSTAGGGCTRCPPNATTGVSSCICTSGTMGADKSCTACPSTAIPTVTANTGSCVPCTSTNKYISTGANGSKTCANCAASQTAAPNHASCFCTAGTTGVNGQCTSCAGAATFTQPDPNNAGTCGCAGSTVYRTAPAATCSACPPGATAISDNSACKCPGGPWTAASGCGTCTPPKVWAPGAAGTPGDCVCTGANTWIDKTDPANPVCKNCPPGSSSSGGTESCTCSPGQTWSNGQCTDNCVAGSGATWDTTLNVCKCTDTNSYYNNGQCVSCGNYATLSTDKKSCVCKDNTATFTLGDAGCKCPAGKGFAPGTSGSCMSTSGLHVQCSGSPSTCVCTAPYTYDDTKKACGCSTGFDTGTTCKACVNGDVNTAGTGCDCHGTYTWDSVNQVCGCQAPFVENDAKTGCVQCPDNSNVVGGKCVCDADNGYWSDTSGATQVCKLCPDNSAVDTTGDAGCLCDGSYGEFNSAQNKCVCNGPNAYADSRNQGLCVTCPDHSTVDTANESCDCGLNAQWVRDQTKCSCNPGYGTWTAGSCVCDGANEFKDTDGSCFECPNGPPTGTTCPCGTNEKWDAQTKTCVCDDNSYSDGHGGCVKCIAPAVKNTVTGDGCTCDAAAFGGGWDSSTGNCVCSPNQYADDNGDCTPCKDGATSDGKTDHCTCPASFSGGFDSTTGGCFCGTDEYRDTNGVCQDCKDGATSDGKGTSCTCGSGFGGGFDSTGGGCFCAVNQYRDTNGDCQDCEDGSTSDGKGTMCTCPSGANDWIASRNKCRCTAANNFKSDDPGATCTPCGGGSTPSDDNSGCVCGNGEGQWHADHNDCLCADGEFKPDDNTPCKACTVPDAKVSTDGKSCDCPKGRSMGGANNDECVLDPGNYLDPVSKEGVPCGDGKSVNDNEDGCVCDNGAPWSTTSTTCTCPSEQFELSGKCTSCVTGSHWKDTGAGGGGSKKKRTVSVEYCECDNGSVWNPANSCGADCTDNSYRDPTTRQCVTCTENHPDESTALTNSCSCKNGETWNSATNNCPCKAQQFRINNGACQSCGGGSVWSGGSTVIQKRQTLSYCSCPNGSPWDPVSNSCGPDCDSLTEYRDGSGACQKCTPENTTGCPCASNKFRWTDGSCQSCPQNASFKQTLVIEKRSNAHDYCTCNNGAAYDYTQNQCGADCNADTEYRDLNGACQTCTAAQTAAQCPCPSNMFRWTDGTCQSCPQNASFKGFTGLGKRTVTEVTTDFCTCNNGAAYDYTQNQCGADCNADTEYRDLSGVCQMCTAAQTAAQCPCASNKFRWTDGSCQSCPQNASFKVFSGLGKRTTGGNTDFCTCNNGAAYDYTQNQCGADCDAATEYRDANGACQMCTTAQTAAQCPCPSEQFRWTDGTCQSCPQGATFKPPSTLTKRSPVAGGSTDCCSCGNGSLYDYTQNKCGADCDSTQYRTADGDCAKCTPDQTAAQCPCDAEKFRGPDGSCQSCPQDATFQVKSLRKRTPVSSGSGLCKCNNGSPYDYNSNSCGADCNADTEYRDTDGVCQMCTAAQTAAQCPCPSEQFRWTDGTCKSCPDKSAFKGRNLRKRDTGAGDNFCGCNNGSPYHYSQNTCGEDCGPNEFRNPDQACTTCAGGEGKQDPNDVTKCTCNNGGTWGGPTDNSCECPAQHFIGSDGTCTSCGGGSTWNTAQDGGGGGGGAVPDKKRKRSSSVPYCTCATGDWDPVGNSCPSAPEECSGPRPYRDEFTHECGNCPVGSTVVDGSGCDCGPGFEAWDAQGSPGTCTPSQGGICNGDLQYTKPDNSGGCGTCPGDIEGMAVNRDGNGCVCPDDLYEPWSFDDPYKCVLKASVDCTGPMQYKKDANTCGTCPVGSTVLVTQDGCDCGQGNPAWNPEDPDECPPPVPPPVGTCDEDQWTDPRDGTCMNCDVNRYPGIHVNDNKDGCVCPNGRTWNVEEGLCDCDGTEVYVDSADQNKCKICPSSITGIKANNDNTGCTCPDNGQWDASTQSCSASGSTTCSATQWKDNNNVCQDCPNVAGVTVSDNKCVCPPGYDDWDKDHPTECTLTGSAPITCSATQWKDGNDCKDCPNVPGVTVSDNKCVCPPGYDDWDKDHPTECTLTGSAPITCGATQWKDGNDCKDCPNVPGVTVSDNKCVCPPGYDDWDKDHPLECNLVGSGPTTCTALQWRDDSNVCQDCPNIAGVTVVNNKCVCPPGYNSWDKDHPTECTLAGSGPTTCGATQWKDANNVCQDCPNVAGVTVSDNKCVCPPGYEDWDKNHPTECTLAGSGPTTCGATQWKDGNECKDCPNVAGVTVSDNKCVCPPGYNDWNSDHPTECTLTGSGSGPITCGATQWKDDNDVCQNCPNVAGVTVLNNNCVCPPGYDDWNKDHPAECTLTGSGSGPTTCGATQWKDGDECKDCPNVAGVTVLNNNCVCPPGYNEWNKDHPAECTLTGSGSGPTTCGATQWKDDNDVCQNCPNVPGVTVSNNNCVCPPGYNDWDKDHPTECTLTGSGSGPTTCGATQWKDGDECKDCPNVAGVTVSDNKCVCPPGYNDWNKAHPSECNLISGNPTQCTATQRKDTNGDCHDCPNVPGVSVSLDKKSCICPTGYQAWKLSKPDECTLTSGSPTTCPAGQKLSGSGLRKTCICIDADSIVTGNGCVKCPTGAKRTSDGKSCNCGNTATFDNTGAAPACNCKTASFVWQSSSGKCVSSITCDAAKKVKLNRDKTACVCMNAKDFMSADGNSCQSCGPYSKLAADGKSCKCDDNDATWDSQSNTCGGCTGGKTFTKGKCILGCDATKNLKLSSDKSKCICSKATQYMSADGGSCRDCGKYSKVGSDGKSCKCDDNDATWDSQSNTCGGCTGGKTFTNGKCIMNCDATKNLKLSSDKSKCVCSKATMYLSADGTSCQPCGEYSKVAADGKSCTCNDSDAVWSSRDNTCGGCPDGKTFVEGKCTTACDDSKGLKLSSDKKSCVCKDSKNYMSADGKSCRPCIAGSSVASDKKSCTCTDNKATWNPSDNTCGCSDSGLTWDTSSKKCILNCDSAKGLKLSSDKGKCVCSDSKSFLSASTGSCVPCVAGSKVSSDGSSCNCIDTTISWTRDNKCPCPAGSTMNPTTFKCSSNCPKGTKPSASDPTICICNNANYYLDGNNECRKCCPGSTLGRYGDNCKCSDPLASFDIHSNTCNCPTGYTMQSGTCVQNKTVQQNGLASSSSSQSEGEGSGSETPKTNRVTNNSSGGGSDNQQGSNGENGGGNNSSSGGGNGGGNGGGADGGNGQSTFRRLRRRRGRGLTERRNLSWRRWIRA